MANFKSKNTKKGKSKITNKQKKTMKPEELNNVSGGYGSLYNKQFIDDGDGTEWTR